MDDQAKFERMLRMLLLLSGARKYSAGELSEKFGMSPRTLSRYIATFRKAGLIVDCDNGIYHIRRLERPLRELQELLYFSEEEAYILLKSIQSIDNTNLLKANLIEKLYSLYNHPGVAETIVKPEHSEIIHKLSEAITGKKQVILCQYRSSHGNIIRDRLVEPFDFSTNYIAFWAFDPESRTPKLFSTARIDKVRILETPFRFEDQHKKLPMDVFRISSDHQLPVELRLSLRACNLLIEEYPLAEKYVTPIGDNFWHFHANVCSYDGVGRFVLGLMDEVHVIESEEFRSYLLNHLKKFQKQF